MILRENTSPTQHHQLVFNPRDYHNAASLKIIQNIAQEAWGNKLERSVEEIKGCYDPHFLKKTSNEVKSVIEEAMSEKIKVGEEEEEFAVRLSVLASSDNSKTIQIALFFPHSKLFQVYPIGPDNKALYPLISPDTAKVARLRKGVLIVTKQHTIRIPLETNMGKVRTMQVNQHSYALVTGEVEQGQGIDPQQWIQTRILKTSEEEVKVKFKKQTSYMQPTPVSDVTTENSPEVQQIKKPVVYVDPENEENVFLLAGAIGDKPNTAIYKLLERVDE